MVPGIIVLIGKVAFLAALYGFLYVVFRGLLSETRRGGRLGAAPAQPEGEPAAVVERWELRPQSVGAPVLRPSTAPGAPGVTVPPPASAEPAGDPARRQPPAFLSAPSPAPEPAPGPEPPDLPGEDPAGSTLEILVPPPAETAPPEEPAPEPSPPAPEPPRPVPALVVLTSPEASLPGGQRFPLAEGVTLGRGEHNSIILKDRFVSAYHAQVECGPGGCTLRDLGSTNGTFRNGARVEGEVALQDGDRIGVGTSVFVFKQGS